MTEMQTLAVWAASWRRVTCRTCGRPVQSFRTVGTGRVVQVGLLARSVNRRGRDGRLVQLFDGSAEHTCRAAREAK